MSKKGRQIYQWGGRSGWNSVNWCAEAVDKKVKVWELGVMSKKTGRFIKGEGDQGW